MNQKKIGKKNEDKNPYLKNEKKSEISFIHFIIRLVQCIAKKVQ